MAKARRKDGKKAVKELSLDEQLNLAVKGTSLTHEMFDEFRTKIIAAFPDIDSDTLLVLLHAFVERSRAGEELAFSALVAAPTFVSEPVSEPAPEPTPASALMPVPETGSIEVSTECIEVAAEEPSKTPPPVIDPVLEERRRALTALQLAYADDALDHAVQLLSLDAQLAWEHAQPFFVECVLKSRYEVCFQLLLIPGWRIRETSFDEFARILIERKELRPLLALLEKGGTTVGFEKFFWSCLAMGRSVRVFSDEWLVSSSLPLRHAIEFGSQSRMTIEIGRVTEADHGRSDRLRALDEEMHVRKDVPASSLSPSWLQRVLTFLSLSWLPSRERVK